MLAAAGGGALLGAGRLLLALRRPRAARRAARAFVARIVGRALRGLRGAHGAPGAPAPGGTGAPCGCRPRPRAAGAGGDRRRGWTVVFGPLATLSSTSSDSSPIVSLTRSGATSATIMPLIESPFFTLRALPAPPVSFRNAIAPWSVISVPVSRNWPRWIVRLRAPRRPPAAPDGASS